MESGKGILSLLTYFTHWEAVSFNCWCSQQKCMETCQSFPIWPWYFTSLFCGWYNYFCWASPKQARVLKRCLDRFFYFSGHFEKSMIYCSSNTCNNVAREISAICGSPLTDNLEKDFGMPLLHSRVSKNTYMEIIEKVNDRLASWKSKGLSMAGRLTLIQSVTSSIPTYVMQTARPPTSVCGELDKLNRNFLWGDTERRHKVHLCQWNLVCRPKCKGLEKGNWNEPSFTFGWRILQHDEARETWKRNTYMVQIFFLLRILGLLIAPPLGEQSFIVWCPDSA